MFSPKMDAFCIVTWIVTFVGLLPTSSTIDYSPDTCRTDVDVPDKNSYRLSYFKTTDNVNPLLDTVCCEKQEYKFSSYITCQRDVNKCTAGFTVSFWMKQLGKKVGSSGSYLISTGGQRSESCGFYIRLNSVNSTSNPPTGIFDVGVSSTDLKWQVLFVVQLQRPMHLMITWDIDLGLDIYVDGRCAGTQITGIAREPIPSCGADDPFPDFLVGRRNDAPAGFCVANIARLYFHLSWHKAADLYDAEIEGSTLAYYSGCIKQAASSSLLSSAPDQAVTYTPATCRNTCLGAGKRYAALIPATEGRRNCYCLSTFEDKNKVDDTECSTVCPGFTDATCGASDRLSVYLTSAFEYSFGALETITEFRVTLVGSDDFIVVHGQTVQIQFSISSGNSVEYFVYGDHRLEEIETTQTTAYLVPPAPGTYVLTAAAVNAGNRQEFSFTVTVLEDIKAIKHLTIIGGVGEVNETSKVQLVMVDGQEVTCKVKFGDDCEKSYDNAESVSLVEHTYSMAGVYNVTIECTGGYKHIRSSTIMVVIEKISINIASSLKLLYGEELVVPFSLTGSNISEVNITFDTTPIGKTCDVNWKCQSIVTPDLYDSVGTHVLGVTADNKLTSTVSAFTDIYIGEPIDGFVVDISKAQVFVEEEVEISIDISGGTQVFITLSIGDLKQLYICKLAPCSYTITAIFPDPEVYLLELEVSNDFSAKQAENVTVSVYHRIPTLTFVIQNVTSLAEAVPIQIKAQPGATWPNDAVASMVVADNTEVTPFTQNEEGIFNYNWNPSDYGFFTMKLNISNALQYIVLQDVVQVGNAIYGLSIQVQERIPIVDHDTEIAIGVTGNPITLIVEFGDGQNLTHNFEMGDDTLSIPFQFDGLVLTTTLTHRYTDTGHYIINVSAFNVFGSVNANENVILHREIEGIYLCLNISVIAPNEPVDIAIALEEAYPPPWNASCIFDFGDGRTVDGVKLTVTHNSDLFISHTYTEPHGNLTISVVCSNKVSIAEMSAEIAVIAPVTNCDLDSPTFTATENSVEFQVSIEGSHLQLEIVTGDGNTILEEWERLASDSEIYTFDHIYYQPGLFYISAKATNLLGTCASNATVNVLNPIIEGNFILIISPAIADISNPMVTVTVNLLDGFKLPSEIKMFVDFGDGSTMNTTYPIPSTDNALEHTYRKTGVFRVSVLFKNLVSEWATSNNAVVMESVGDLRFNISSNLIAVEENVNFVMLTSGGTNLTYHVIYGDGASESFFTERATGATFTHKYDHPGRYVVTFVVVNKLGRVTDNSTEIHIVTPIYGLSLAAQPDVVHLPGTVDLILSQTQGNLSPTEMNCTWNFGNGSNSFIQTDVKVSENTSVALTRAYPGGEYEVVVTCTNPLNRADVSTEIKVYESISKVDVRVDASTVKVGTEVTFTVRISSGSLLTYSFEFGDGAIEHRNISQSKDTKSQVFRHQYSDDGDFQANVTISNGIRTQTGSAFEVGTINMVILYGTDMFLLSTENSGLVPTGEVRYILNILPKRNFPNTVNLHWSFGDGKMNETIVHFTKSDLYSITHKYDSPGTYTATVLVSTDVESNNYTVTVILVERAQPLDVYIQYIEAEDVWVNGHGPHQNWMPARTKIKFFANTTLPDVEITWSFGDDSNDITSNIAYHVYEAVNWYNVTVKIHNSNHTLIKEYFDLFIVEDTGSLSISALTTDDLSGDIWLQSETSFVLESTYPIGPSCVLWDMGDNSPAVIYGPPPCAEDTLIDDMVFFKIDAYLPESYKHRHTYDTPGYYKVRVEVENYVTIQNYTIKDVVIVKGCSEPIKIAFQGTGQDVYHPRQYLSSDKIPLDPSVFFPCVGIEHPEFKWAAKKLNISKDGSVKKSDVYIEPLERPKRTLEPLTFKPGLYEIQLAVGVPGYPGYTGTDSIFLEIESSPLMLKIHGGTSRAVGSVDALIVDAVQLSHDPDDPGRSADTWTFVWTCYRMPLNYQTSTTLPVSTEVQEIPRYCDSLAPETLETDRGVIKLDAMMLRVDSLYSFRVTAYVNNKSKSTKQVVIIKEGDLPAVSIICVTNCKGKMNPTSSFALQGSCTNCQASMIQYLTYKWILYERNGPKYVKQKNLSRITSTGEKRAGINFIAGVLEEGNQYRLRLTIIQPSGAKGYSEFVFKTNLPPYNGSCSVTPKSGFAISTRFNVHCINWIDEGNNLERPLPGDVVDESYLQYRVLQRLRGTSGYSLMYSGEESTISDLIFGVGPPQYNHTFELKVQVIDKYGAKAETDLTIEVVETVLESEDLETLVTSNSSRLQQLVAVGDAEGATQLITAVLSVLADQGNATSEFTEEEVKEIQTNLLDELTKVSVWASTIEELYSAASALSHATAGSAHAQALFHAALTMASMATKLESVSDDSPEEVLSTAEGLTDALGNLMTQSEDIVNGALEDLVEFTDPTQEPEEVDEYAPGAVDPELLSERQEEELARRAVEVESARYAAKTISGITKRTLNSVADVLCGQQVSGQPPAVMDTGAIKAEFFVEEASKMAGRAIAATGGSFSLPSAEDLFPNVQGGNLKQKFYAFTANPYAWDINALEVGTEGALGLDFESGLSEPVTVRNLTKPISIILENGKTKLIPVELEFWNSTVKHHLVEVVSNDTDLRLIVKPDNSTTVRVFVRYGVQANTTHYDYKCEIPRNLTEDETWTDPDIIEEAKHTVYIPSSNGSGAGNYYVTISLTGNLSIPEMEEELPTADLPTAGLVSDVEYLPVVELSMYVAGCRYWNEEMGGWVSEGCELGPLTNSRYTQCLCTHLSDFASAFFVPPNSIDFSTGFLKFKNLGDNAAVFSTVFALFGVYLILVVWLRRKDKQDVIKWGVTPLSDNNPNHKYYYQISVETGMRPSSGTSSKVGIIISGDLFDSGVRLLDDNKREVFARGSVNHFLMSVEGHLGPLSFMKIWHDNSGEGDMAGWYLSKVAVLDIQTGEQFYFICERWLAVEQDDGSVDRLLPVASKSELMQFSQLFYSGSREKLFDDHLWFSLFTRPTRSHFTRVQRLSCCLSLLYCSMIANAMFYRSEENVEKSSSVRLGPFVFSGQQIFVGFISALVVVPINVAIVQIFRKSKPSKKDKANAALPEDAQKKLEELEKPSKKKLEKVDVIDVAEEKVPTEPDDPVLISAEEFQQTKAYDPKETMEMIDGVEYNCSASTETLHAADSPVHSLNQPANINSQKMPSHSVADSENRYLIENEEEHKVEGKNPVEDGETQKDESKNVVEIKDPQKDKDKKSENKKKEEFMLPHCCVYIAWFLFALSCLVSAFFTILYSLEWGAEKSSEWLTAMLLSFFNSVVLIQPLKVLVIVTVLSLIFKKPAKMEADTDTDAGSLADNQLNSDEEYLHQQGANAKGFPFVRKPLSKEELQAARKRRFQEIRMYSVIRETVIYTIYVTVLLFLCYSNRDTLAFWVSKSIRDNFVEGHAGENTTLTFHSLSKSTPDLFWDWMEKSIIPGLYGDVYYNGEPMHWRHSRFLSDWQSYRVGPARLRQLRVKPDICKAPKESAFMFPHCRRKYSSDNEEEGSFSIGWKPPRNVTYEIGKSPEFIPDDELMPWRYQTTLDLNGVPYPGKLTLYGGGGFVAEFGVSMARAYEIARFLRDNDWYDELTRAIFLEFTIYNANSNLFSVAQIAVELPTTGGGVMTNYVHTFRLYHYYGAAVVVSVVLQLLFVIYIIYFTVKLILKLRKEGWKELATFWTFVELVTLFLAFSAVGLFAIRQIFIYFSIKEVRNKNEGNYVNFAHIAKWDELFGYMMAFLAYLAILRYMRLLRLSPRMCMFGLTMSSASSGIICFSIMFFVMYFAYGQMATLLFGHVVYAYSSLLTTMETLFAMMLGSFEFNPLREANGTLGPIFFVSYIVTMFFILSNMFITLISDAFGEVNANTTPEDTGDEDTELVDFMMERLKEFLSSFYGSGGGKKLNKEEPKKGEEEETTPLDLVESRVDQLLAYVSRNYGEVDVPSDNDSNEIYDSAASLSGIAVGTLGSPLPKSTTTTPKVRSSTKSVLVT